MTKPIGQLLPFGAIEGWQMEAPERLCLAAFLDFLRPDCSLEVGTKYGGSLAALSRYSKRVFSLDIDPTVPQRLQHFINVEFITGDSCQTLPQVLSQLQREAVPLSFMLIDGSHTAQGVRSDCESLLSYRPTAPLYVLMHDSFNPDVRAGIRSVEWERSPNVHMVELDFIPGRMFSDGELRGEMWGGFALAILKAESRVEPLQISALSEAVYKAAHYMSAHTLIGRFRKKAAAL